VPGLVGELTATPKEDAMAYTIPKTDFQPHPAGRHVGRIIQHEDKGLQDTPWGTKHKVAIYVESETAFMEDGAPFLLVQWFTLSSNERASLRKFREAVLDRPLNDDEIACFDADAELLWRRIRFRVDHTTNDAGKVRAVIHEGSVEPLQDSDDEVALADDAGEEEQATPPRTGRAPAPAQRPVQAAGDVPRTPTPPPQASTYRRPTGPQGARVGNRNRASMQGQAQITGAGASRQHATAGNPPAPGEDDLPF
jgi:hypothetical protein